MLCFLPELFPSLAWTENSYLYDKAQLSCSLFMCSLTPSDGVWLSSLCYPTTSYPHMV